MSAVKMSVRFSIVGFSTIAVLIFGGVISLVSYIGGKNSVESLVKSIMQNASQHTIDKTTNYLDAAVETSKMSEDYLKSGLLKTDNRKVLEKYFEGILKVNPELIGMFYGSETGEFFMVKEMPDKTYSSQTILRKGKFSQINWEHQKNSWYDDPKYDDELIDTEKAYDPRTRPWYKEAIASKTHSWTDVYVFFNDRKPGITCSRAVLDKAGKIIGVIGIDISIRELSEFLYALKIGKTGKVFLHDSKSKIVAIPSNDPKVQDDILKEETDASGKKSLQLLRVDEVTDVDIKSAFTYFEKNKKEILEAENNHDFFEYTANGKSYFAKFTPFKKDDIQWTIGIVVPENDFMGTVHRNNQIILLISIIMIIFAVFAEYRFSQKISKPLTQLAEEMEKIQKFDLSSEVVIQSFLYEVNNMTTSFNKMKTGLKSFKKYVPDELVRELIALNKEAVLEGERREMTIYFSDIAGFTSISEELAPEELVDLLSDYLGSASKTITDHHGTLDKYIGDAVMAFWGAPTPIEDHAMLACKSALLHKKILKKKNAERVANGRTPFYDRIGIHTGEVIVGNMGSENRLNYTVLGDSVNLASRLEAINKFYGSEIIISGSTYAKIGDSFLVKMLDLVAVKGKSKAIEIFELISELDDSSLEEKRYISLFNDAVTNYRKKNFEAALKIFESNLRLNPNDYSVKLYLERCKNFIQNPPPSDWVGAYESKEK
jgi:adenylate cyclase